MTDGKYLHITGVQRSRHHQELVCAKLPRPQHTGSAVTCKPSGIRFILNLVHDKYRKWSFVCLFVLSACMHPHFQFIETGESSLPGPGTTRQNTAVTLTRVWEEQQGWPTRQQTAVTLTHVWEEQQGWPFLATQVMKRKQTDKQIN